MLEILLASLAVMLVALIGKITVWGTVGPLIERNLHFFVSFAAGVLLVVAYHLGEEIVHEAGSLAAGLPWIVIGALVVMLGFRYLPHFHHHHDAHQRAHAHTKIDANRVLLSDGIHNIGDGVVIAASFAVSPFLGIMATISIAVHEALQEISEFFVLRGAGLSVNRALLYNFLAASTILIGAVGGYFLLERFEALFVPLLGLAAGSYLVVVFHDLLPHSVEDVRASGHALRHIMYFSVGLALMTLLVLTVPHVEYDHGEHDTHHSESGHMHVEEGHSPERQEDGHTSEHEMRHIIAA